MASIWKALTWHYVRQALPMLTMMVFVMIAGPLAVKGLFLLDGLEFEVDFLSGNPHFYFNYLPLAFLFFGVVVFAGQDGIRRAVYPLPVSNGELVAWHLVLAMASVAVQNVLVVSVYRALFEVNWPILAPTVLMMAAVVLAHALIWLLYDFSFARLAGCGLVAAGFVWWSIRLHYPQGRGSEPAFLVELTAETWLTLTAIVTAAWYVCVHMIRRHRRSETRLASASGDPARKFDEFLFDLFSPPQPEFFSGLSALRWSEWRQARLVAIAAGVLLAAIPLGGAIVAQFVSTGLRFVEGCVVITCWMSVVTGLIGGQVVCMNVWKSPATGGMSTFLATAPVSDRDMGRILLRNVFQASLLLWLVVTVLGLALPTFGLLNAEADVRHATLLRFRLYEEHGAAIIPVVLGLTSLAAWSLAGTFGVLTLTGSNRLTGGVFFTLMAAGIASMFVIRFILPEPARAIATMGVCLITSLAAAGVSGWLFHRARRRDLVSSRSLLKAGAVWLIECAVLVSVLPVPPVWRAVACGLATLTVAPLASAPLAISWNRHRPC